MGCSNDDYLNDALKACLTTGVSIADYFKRIEGYDNDNSPIAEPEKRKYTWYFKYNAHVNKCNGYDVVKIKLCDGEYDQYPIKGCIHLSIEHDRKFIVNKLILSARALYEVGYFDYIASDVDIYIGTQVGADVVDKIDIEYSTNILSYINTHIPPKMTFQWHTMSYYGEHDYSNSKEENFADYKDVINSFINANKPRIVNVSLDKIAKAINNQQSNTNSSSDSYNGCLLSATESLNIKEVYVPYKVTLNNYKGLDVIEIDKMDGCLTELPEGSKCVHAVYGGCYNTASKIARAAGILFNSDCLYTYDYVKLYVHYSESMDFIRRMEIQYKYGIFGNRKKPICLFQAGPMVGFDYSVSETYHNLDHYMGLIAPMYEDEDFYNPITTITE